MSCSDSPALQGERRCQLVIIGEEKVCDVITMHSRTLARRQCQKDCSALDQGLLMCRCVMTTMGTTTGRPMTWLHSCLTPPASKSRRYVGQQPEYKCLNTLKLPYSDSHRQQIQAFLAGDYEHACECFMPYPLSKHHSCAQCCSHQRVLQPMIAMALLA